MLLFLAALGGLLFFGIKFFPFFGSQSFGKFERYNFVIAQHPLAVISLETKTKSAVVILLPDNLQVDAAHGYGRLPVVSVYQAGQLDSRGELVLKDTVSDMLGISVDAAMFTDDPILTKNSYQNHFAFLRPSLFKTAKGANLLDRLQLAWTWTQLRADKIKLIDLQGESLSEEVVMGDGSKALVLDKDKLDQLLADQVFSPGIRNEGLRIGVVNATEFNGLGAKAARILSNQGASVVSVDTKPSQQAECELQFSDDKKGKSLTAIFGSDYFSCRLVKNPNLDNRFDLLIILGGAYARVFAS